MSQVLNCIWVLLSVWAFVHWLCRSSRRRPARRVGLFGLICALAVLFPVISDNDDILQQQLLAVPESPLLKSFLNVKVACENGALPVISALHALFPTRAALEFVRNELPVFLSATSLGASGDRSPPRIS